MSIQQEHTVPIDYERSNEARGVTISREEAQHLQRVLSPLVEECRTCFSIDLGLVDPIGTFRLAAVPDRD